MRKLVLLACASILFAACGSHTPRASAPTPMESAIVRSDAGAPEPKDATPEAAPANETAERSATGKMCGGFGGIACPPGYACVDNPNDDCDPEHGGADCAGICK